MNSRFEYGPVHPGIPPHPEYGPAYQSKSGPVYRSEYGPVHPSLPAYLSIEDPTLRAAAKRKIDDEVNIMRAEYKAKQAIRDAAPRPPHVIEYYSAVKEAKIIKIH